MLVIHNNNNNQPLPKPCPKSQPQTSPPPLKKTWKLWLKKTNHIPAKKDFHPKYSSCKLSVDTWGLYVYIDRHASHHRNSFLLLSSTILPDNRRIDWIRERGNRRMVRNSMSEIDLGMFINIVCVCSIRVCRIHMVLTSMCTSRKLSKSD